MKNIILIGPMGAGKSSVGKSLAQVLKMDFYDSDEEIEKSTGVDIGWIFDVEGEEGFRKRERAVLEELTAKSNIVLATGGGSILEVENQLILMSNGTLIYLHVSLSSQDHRTLNDSRRPMLRTQNRLEVLKKLYAEREPIYEALADYSIYTDNRSVQAVVDDIVAWLQAENKIPL